MTVKDLIEELKKYPQDTVVVYPYEDSRYFSPDSFELKNLEEDGFFMECWKNPNSKIKYRIMNCLIIS